MSTNDSETEQSNALNEDTKATNQTTHEKPKGFTEWAKDNILKIISIAGAIWYAGLWICYYDFYAHFGVELNEIGLDQTTMILQSLPYFIIMAMLVFVIFIFLIFDVIMLTAFIRSMHRLIITIWGLFSNVARKKSDSKTSFEADNRDSLASKKSKNKSNRENRRFIDWIKPVFLILSITIVITGFFALGIYNSIELRKRVVNGKSIYQPFIGEKFIPNPFAIRAEKADVYLKESYNSGKPLSDSFFYFGSNGKITVLFDYQKGDILRIPSNSVIVVTQQKKSK